MEDIELLTRLSSLFKSRPLPPMRRQPWRRYGITLRRDPVEIAHRYLRRFAGGQWHQGGSHVARLNFGPGIGFRIKQTPKVMKATPILLNLP